MVNGIPAALRGTAGWPRAAQWQRSAADTGLLAVRATSDTEASIGITTDDGDTVTITLSSDVAAGYAWYRPQGAGPRTSVLAITAARAGAITVRGELDEQETRDIARLVAGLARAIRSFLKGNLGAAIHQALGGPPLESLAGFTLGLRHSDDLEVVAAGGTPPAGGAPRAPDPADAPLTDGAGD